MGMCVAVHIACTDNIIQCTVQQVLLMVFTLGTFEFDKVLTDSP